jgi:hypothetical protein
VAAEQLREWVPLLPPQSRPLLIADRGYGNAPFLQATQGLACDKLLRIAKNRVFYRPAPPPTGKRGAPRKDGDRFKCNDPSTHGPADEHWEGPDEQGHLQQVDCWPGLHLQQARALPLSLIRVRRSRVATKRQPTESWFVWQGQEVPPLGEIWALYSRRYSLEHSYRFDKQHLLWAAPRLRTPEQFERWTQVVAAVHNQLVLAHSLVQAVRLPWESHNRPVTLQQVRRAMGGIIGMLGTPAQRVQPRGKSPGRLPGATIEAAERFPVVFKAKPISQKGGKAT